MWGLNPLLVLQRLGQRVALCSALVCRSGHFAHALQLVCRSLRRRPAPTLPGPLGCRLHGELAGDVVRNSASAVQQELLECYALIEKKGRGVVYYGSAR